MDDLISRHGVSAWLDNMGHPKLADAILDEKRFPPADKPVGEWIENEDQHHVEIIYHCSECGFQAWGDGELTNFCGGCGARMVNGNE